MNRDTTELADKVSQEAARLEESARHGAQNQFELHKQWRLKHFALSIPAAALAAASGVTALSEMLSLAQAGWLAVASAAVTAVVTALNPNAHAARAQVAGNGYLSVQRRARQLRDMGSLRYEAAEFASKLDELWDDYDANNREASPPNWLARRRGRRNAEGEPQRHAIDKRGT